MWNLGNNNGSLLLVPTHWEVESAAMDIWLAKKLSWLQSQEVDWRLAEQMAREYVASSLFWRLGRNRAASQPLAAKLVRFSMRAHEYWWNHGGIYKPRESHVTRPGDFLAGMGGELLGGDGWQLMEQAPEWPSETDKLAYKLWEAQSHRHGRDRQHWQLAEWLLRLTHTASRLVAGGRKPNQSHFLEALGAQLFYDPCGSLRVFELGLTLS